VVSGGVLAITYLMWTYDQLLPAKPKGGTVTGHVTRAVQTSTGVTYVGPGVFPLS
jgi:hypothetical protein